MSRTTAKLGVFLFGLVIAVSAVLSAVDPEPGTTPRPILAGAFVLVGAVAMVKSFGMMREQPASAAKRRRSAKP
jgi:hypothetical protein